MRGRLEGGALIASVNASPSGGLWRHGDFLRLWAAQTVSSFGARITREGLYYAAVMALGASDTQLGVLAALARGSGVVVGLFGGGVIDRKRRRPLMIGADILRALALATVPLAAWLGVLTLAHLCVAAALVGALGVAFDIADHAFLPNLIDRRLLVDGNAKLAATESVAEIGGPAVTGVLFQLLTAPIAIAVNAATYLASAFILGTIRAAEDRPAAPRAEHPLADVQAGLSIAMGHPLLRPLLLMSVASALFGSFYSALYVVFALKSLALTPSMLGVTIAMGGVGSVAGAAFARPLTRRLGIGGALVVTGLGAAASSLFIPFAGPGPLAGMAMLIAAQLIGDALGTVSEIATVSLRQSLLESEVMGRVGGAFAAAGGLMAMVGAISGGALADVIGPRTILFVGSAGMIGGALIGLASPLRRYREPASLAG